MRGSAETFTRFGEKMNEAKKESEKRTTQLLENGGRKSKTVQRKVMKQTFSRNGRAASSLAPPKPQQQPQHHHPHPHHHHHHPPAGSAIGGAGAGPGSRDYLSGKHPLLDRKRPGGAGGHGHGADGGTANPQLMKRPLRERLIHLLAVRPMKKPELLDRVTRGTWEGKKGGVLRESYYSNEGIHRSLME